VGTRIRCKLVNTINSVTTKKVEVKQGKNIYCTRNKNKFDEYSVGVSVFLAVCGLIHPPPTA
jgi:hypothetical protein